LYINDLRVSKQTWHKIIYVSVHIGLLNMTFDFQPYDSHHRYFLSLSGKECVNSPYPVMSIDPQSNVIDTLLGAMETVRFRNAIKIVASSHE